MNTSPTALPELNDVLLELLSGVQHILGTHLYGAYLQGSFASGDWDENSDVDFLMLLESDIPEALLPELQALHARIYKLPSAWAQHLEGSYISRATLRDLKTSVPLWYLDNGSTALIQSTHCNTLVVRWQLREHGVVLFGADPKTLLEPILPEALRHEVVQTMRSWGSSLLQDPSGLENRWFQQYVVLSFCRFLQTIQTARVESKRSGAVWAQTNLEPKWSDLIALAWQEHPQQRQNYKLPADPAEAALTLEFIQYVLELAQ